MKYHILFIIFIFLLKIPIPTLAQTAVITTNEEVGIPFIQNFNPKIDGNYKQNWSILQDSRGIMYFANSSGVLEYDGVTWRQIKINKEIARSLAQDTNGRIYVGSNNDFGYLAPDSMGQLQYRSLLEHIPPDQREFSNIWQIAATSHGIYFKTDKDLFRWQPAENPETLFTTNSELPGHIDILTAKTSFHVIFNVQNTLYIRQRGIGLMKLTGDSLQLVPGGEQFSDERVYVMLPFSPLSTNKSQTEQAEYPEKNKAGASKKIQI